MAGGRNRRCLSHHHFFVGGLVALVALAPALAHVAGVVATAALRLSAAAVLVLASGTGGRSCAFLAKRALNRTTSGGAENFYRPFLRFFCAGTRVPVLKFAGDRTLHTPFASASSTLVSSASLRAYPGWHSLVLGVPSDSG
jgi:hypothetical protein